MAALRRGPEYGAIFYACRTSPAMEARGGLIQVFVARKMGDFTGAVLSEIIGLDVQSTLTLSWNSILTQSMNMPCWSGRRLPFENTVLEDDAVLSGQLPCSVSFTSRSGSRVLLIGGPPFPETILMWWNFVGDPEEIAQAPRRLGGPAPLWSSGRRTCARLAAPELVRFARQSAS